MTVTFTDMCTYTTNEVTAFRAWYEVKDELTTHGVTPLAVQMTTTVASTTF